MLLHLLLSLLLMSHIQPFLGRGKSKLLLWSEHIALHHDLFSRCLSSLHGFRELLERLGILSLGHGLLLILE